MDNEMIERVSKAIINTPNASDYEKLVAINAIKAMREPTEKMKMAVSYMDTNVYTSMINAIINE